MQFSQLTLPRLLAGCLLGASALGAVASTPARGLRGLAAGPAPVRTARRSPPAPMKGGARAASEAATTLLDEVGRLARPVTPAQAAAWRVELVNGHPVASRAAGLHLRLGEYELAHDQEPEEASGHFRQARRLLPATEPGAGLAAYDSAIASFYAGAYPEATAAFRRLLRPAAVTGGYDRRRCALWYRRAGAAAGYHATHARAGIPEPTRLDPLCGVAGLAVCLRQLGLPYDRARVAAACRHTGEGSSLADLAAACPKLGLAGRPVTADEKGLRLLPKPLIAHVEQDHFVAVVRADAQGIAYVCSDCGCWPGGRVELTWKQWRALDPGPYLAVARRGSRHARLLAALPARRDQQPAPVRLAAAGSLSRLHLGGLLLNQTLLGLLKGHVLLYTDVTGAAGCGLKPSALHCLPWDSCPMDGACGSSAGPSAGDPVNLATGEEEYQPGPDLTVYNPYGPSIVWSRTYNSLRGPGDDYEADDFGIGWSHPYNVLVKDLHYDPTAGPNMQTKWLMFPNGSQLTFTPRGLPTSGQPPVACDLGNAGVPLAIQWAYDPNSSFGDYLVLFGDGTRWTFSTQSPGKVDATAGCAWYQLSKIENRLIRKPNDPNHPFGGLVFNYNTTSGRSGFHGLTSIADASSGMTLLTVNRGGAAGQIASVKDASGRYVYYTASDHATGDPAVPQYLELDTASQIQPGPTTMAPARWTYMYANVSNGLDPGDTVPSLSQIIVPSPSGSGNQTATITYDDATFAVLNTKDANGTYRIYSQMVPPPQGVAAETQVQISQYAMPTPAQVLFAYTVECCEPDLERTLITDGTNDVNATTGVTKITYDSTAPYRPASIVDGNGKERDFQWDEHGNMTMATAPHTPQAASVVTHYTWETTDDFPVGRLKTVQEVSKLGVAKTTATLDYFPSTDAVNYGRLMKLHTPTPGTAGSGATVETAYTYDDLGNVLTITQPGTNTASSILTTFQYVSDANADGSVFTQPGGWPQIGEPLSVMDAAHKLTHFRYSVRGDLISARDALNNTASALFNVAGQPLALALPMTGEQGCATDTTVRTYQYPGGPLIKSQLYDETGTGTPVRTANYAYGNEGEFHSRSGDTEAITQTYDPMMRLSAVTDGRNYTTHFNYQPAGEPGYLQSIEYPGTDTVQFPLYDGDGRPTMRIDGNGVVTNYDYSEDPMVMDNDAGQLRQITYSNGGSAPNVTLSYDDFGRPKTMVDGAGTQTYTYL